MNDPHEIMAREAQRIAAVDCNSHRPGDGSWWARDARGIELCRVCEDCEDEKLARYRHDVLSNSQYDADETIEPEDY